MAGPFDQFIAQTTKWIGDFQKNAPLILKECAREAGKLITEGTPVDMGKARTNWLMGVNLELHDELDPYFGGYPKYSQAAGQGRSETMVMAATLEQHDMALAHVKSADDKIYLVN